MLPLLAVVPVLFPSGLISVIIVLAIIGLLLWAITQIPMDAAIARMIRIVVIVACCIYLIYFLAGMLPGRL